MKNRIFIMRIVAYAAIGFLTSYLAKRLVTDGIFELITKMKEPRTVPLAWYIIEREINRLALLAFVLGGGFVGIMTTIEHYLEKYKEKQGG